MTTVPVQTYLALLLYYIIMQIQELKTQAYDIIVEIERARMYIEDKQKALQQISNQINEEEKKELQKNTGNNPPKKA